MVVFGPLEVLWTRRSGRDAPGHLREVQLDAELILFFLCSFQLVQIRLAPQRPQRFQIPQLLHVFGFMSFPYCDLFLQTIGFHRVCHLFSGYVGIVALDRVGHLVLNFIHCEKRGVVLVVPRPNQSIAPGRRKGHVALQKQREGPLDPVFEGHRIGFRRLFRGNNVLPLGHRMARWLSVLQKTDIQHRTIGGERRLRSRAHVFLIARTRKGMRPQQIRRFTWRAAGIHGFCIPHSPWRSGDIER
mmetsp:Transcript_91923/g.259674  ORF Transcript_91923/g.259674 Transcript_91923/m.259674 type:complete len:244 (+) Transcript_91923:1676-2407(+)